VTLRLVRACNAVRRSKWLIYTEKLTAAPSSDTDDDVATTQTANLHSIQALHFLVTVHI
jgi:hypothetical protein